MLLSLFKLTMIVSLLISAICIEINKESPSEKNKAVVESSEPQDVFLKEDTEFADDHNENSLVQKRQSSKHNRYSDDQDSRARRNNVRSMERRVSRAGDKNLAHKMAKDALKSPKMQETIKKLSRVTKPGSTGTVYAAVKLPPPGKSRAKQSRIGRKQDVHKGKKKKRKRQHRKYKNEHGGWSKRGSSKRTSKIGRDVNASAKKLIRTEKSLNKHHNHDESKGRPSTSKSNERVTRVQAEDSDYVDFSTPLNIESLVLSRKSPKGEGSVKLRDSERMIDSLMRTTTRDPLKKSSGDQGIEYSDYYSDDEVLQDIEANKIPIQIVESKNSNDRFARQAVNSTSHHRIDRNVQPYRRNRFAGKRNFRHAGGAIRRAHRLHKYPKWSAALNRNSRFLGLDNSWSNYVPNYRPTDDRYEHLDPMYPVNNEEVLQQPQISKQDAVLDMISDNLDVLDQGKSNDEIQQQISDQYNYLNDYEVPQQEDFNSFTSNEDVENEQMQNEQMQNEQMQNEQMQNEQMQNEQMQNEPPQFSNRFNNPDLNMQNYQPMDTSLQRVENFDQSVMNQPRMENIRLFGPTEDIEVQSQPSLSTVQSYGNPDEDQTAKSVSMQETNNLPQMCPNNAIDQPLGKVLESLGINVNTDSSRSNQNANLEYVNPAVNNPIMHSDTLDHPEEHILSPNYLQQKIKAEINKNNAMNLNDNANESNRQMNRTRNENKESHTRRQSNGYDDQLFPYPDNSVQAAHNMNISIAVQDTKEIANQILDTIMEELEELKLDQMKNNKKEGLPCRLSGSWSTSQAGMKLNMTVVNRNIIVTVSELTTPRIHGSLLNGTWNISGHAPFKRGAPFTLTATNNSTKSIAVFVGACRVCQGVDTIVGIWSVARQPNDCEDFQVATSAFNDIFRKTKLSSLKENQNSTMTESTMLKHDKRKS